MQIMQSVAYAPEGGQHAPWAIEVCLEQLDALLQRLFGKSLNKGARACLHMVFPLCLVLFDEASSCCFFTMQHCWSTRS